MDVKRADNFNDDTIGVAIHLSGDRMGDFYTFHIIEGRDAFAALMKDGLGLLGWKQVPVEFKTGIWQKLKVTVQNSRFHFFVNDKLAIEFEDASLTAGKCALEVSGELGVHLRFDNVVISGSEVPNGGPGAKALEPRWKLGTVWGRIKRGD